jgi:hypothetical protein
MHLTLSRLPPVLLLLVACGETDAGDSATTELPDLTELLGAGEVRAGIVTDVRALFGGISAEGAPGDVKLYNDRVQFVIEAVGDSSYYNDYGGNLIDADFVRPAGQPGRDLVDELAPMLSLGRVVDATAVDILEDGSDGVAHVQVRGPAAPLRLVTGAVENLDAVPWYDLFVTTDYTLKPGEWTVEVKTTVENRDARAFLASVGLFGFYAQEIAQPWRPRTGYADPDGEAVAMEGLLGASGQSALAMMAGSGLLEPSAIGDLIAGLGAGATAFDLTHSIAPGESYSWTSRLGVAPDLATLETERLAREGVAHTPITGTVLAAGLAVAGARVFSLDATGAPLTVAMTQADGSFTLPGSEVASLVATGRGQAIVLDLPEGHGNVSPYDRSPDEALESLANGATPVPFAEGYGISEPVAPDEGATLTLAPPATLAISVADGGPAAVVVDFADGDPVSHDDRVARARPSGHAAIGFIRDGTLDMPLEPGAYRVTVHRGVRYEAEIADVTLTGGEVTALPVTLTPAYTLDGIVTIDPHAHASPSGDGGLPMEDRLLVAAGNGVEVHVGTDHDHIVDYRPVVTALGLDAWLHSIVAEEVSPVLKGHFNAYPAERTGRPNGGAPRWWQQLESTASLFGRIRERIGTDGILQANHPVSGSGMFSAADYSTTSGTIGQADRWSDDFDAMELLNSGDHEDYFPFYADLVARGKLVTPVGVSDSHTWTSGEPGLNVTFLHTGGTLAEFGPDPLKKAMAARATVVSYGPYIEAQIDGVWAPGRILTAAGVDVRVLAPSWMPVERLQLVRDGLVVDEIACAGAAPEWCVGHFAFGDDADASYIIVADSTTGMAAVWPGRRAWAATSAILNDVAADGWAAPLPPLVVQ